MEPDAAKKVQDRFDELPPDIRQAVESADLDKHVQTIGAKHRLHLDQMGLLQDETLLVMLGFESPDNFVNALTKATGIPQDQAAAIATDINNEIVGPIRDSLRKFSAQKATPASAPAPATPPPAPPAPTTPAAIAPKPQVPLAPHPQDLMLVEKTVTVPASSPTAPTTAASVPPKPDNYKSDPYREPVEP